MHMIGVVIYSKSQKINLQPREKHIVMYSFRFQIIHPINNAGPSLSIIVISSANQKPEKDNVNFKMSME